MSILIIQSNIPTRGKSIKLRKSDRSKYDGSIYTVVAVIWATVYLSVVDDGTADYDYEMQEVYKKYRDVKIIGKET